MDVLLGLIGLVLMALLGLSFAGFIIGLIKPAAALPNVHPSTRAHAAKIYGAAMALSLALVTAFGAMVGKSEDRGKVEKQTANAGANKGDAASQAGDGTESSDSKSSSEESGPGYVGRLKEASRKAGDSPIENVASIKVEEEGGGRKAVFRLQNRMSGDWRLVTMHWGESIRAISKSIYPDLLSEFDTIEFHMENQSESGNYILYSILTYETERIEEILSGGADFSHYFLREVSDIHLRHFGEKASKTYCSEYGENARAFCKKAGFQVGGR